MNPSSVSLLLGLAVLQPSTSVITGPVFLKVSQNRLQFLVNETVSLICDGLQRSSTTGWTMRRTVGTKTQMCGKGLEDFGSFDGIRFSCVVSVLSSATDSGVYWCENNTGQKSPELNITVADVILDVPLHPVMTGGDVTLRCKATDLSTGNTHFFKDGVQVGSGSEEKFTISKVQTSDAGFYSCANDVAGMSSKSRLTVSAPSLSSASVDHLTLPSHADSSDSTSTLLSSLAELLLPVAAGLILMIALVSSLAVPLLICRKQTDFSVQLQCGLLVLAGVVIVLLTGLTLSTAAVLAPNVPGMMLLCCAVVFCPYCIATILTILLCFNRKSGNNQETDERVGEDNNVTTEYDF